MAQIIRPDSDIQNPAFWTSTDGDGILYNDINEATRNDSNGIQSAANQLALCEVGLANPASAPLGSTATVHLTALRTVTNKNYTLVCRLMEGSTQRGSITIANPATTFPVTPQSFSATGITNYSNLSLQFETTVAAGGGGRMEVSWAYVEVPDGAVVVSGSVTADAVVFATVAASVTSNAILHGTLAGSLTADANIVTIETGSISADAIMLDTVAPTGLSADAIVLGVVAPTGVVADAIVLAVGAGAVTADAEIVVATSTVPGSFSADSIMLGVVAGSLSVDAVLLATAAGSVSADAVVFATVAASVSADAVVDGGGATWTTPADGAPVSDLTPTLAFMSPESVRDMYFELQLDTASTFDTGALRTYRSYPDATGWEYFNGVSWQPLSATGLLAADTGSEVRFSVPTDLTTGVWYRRVRASL